MALVVCIRAPASRAPECFEDGMVLDRYTASLVGPIEAVLAVKLWQAISLSATHLCQTLVRWESRESSNSRRTALLWPTFTQRTDSGSGHRVTGEVIENARSRSRLFRSHALYQLLA